MGCNNCDNIVCVQAGHAQQAGKQPNLSFGPAKICEYEMTWTIFLT